MYGEWSIWAVLISDGSGLLVRRSQARATGLLPQSKVFNCPSLTAPGTYHDSQDPGVHREQISVSRILPGISPGADGHNMCIF